MLVFWSRATGTDYKVLVTNLETGKTYTDVIDISVEEKKGGDGYVLNMTKHQGWEKKCREDCKILIQMHKTEEIITDNRGNNEKPVK